ncbi:MAG: hypothetical protein ACRDBY_14075 [Cetobacterium sp.]
MAKLKELEVSLGISLEVNKVWYRPTASIKLEMDETDTVEKRKLIWKSAWQTVSTEVERQIIELTK